MSVADTNDVDTQTLPTPFPSSEPISTRFGEVSIVTRRMYNISKLTGSLQPSGSFPSSLLSDRPGRGGNTLGSECCSHSHFFVASCMKTHSFE